MCISSYLAIQRIFRPTTLTKHGNCRLPPSLASQTGTKALRRGQTALLGLDLYCPIWQGDGKCIELMNK